MYLKCTSSLVLFAFLLLPLLLVRCVFAQAEGPFFIGDIAPPIETELWPLGEPITEFAPGKLYVVEFWATWCGPCLKTIPLLSELQSKYSDKLIVVGIAALEHGESPSIKRTALEEFLRINKQKIGYRIAFDSTGKMTENWLNRSNQNQIPVAFIVDTNGKIAYIGSPDEVENSIEQILSGTWDPANLISQHKAKLLINEENQHLKKLIEVTIYSEDLSHLPDLIREASSNERSISLSWVSKFIGQLIEEGHGEKAETLGKAMVKNATLTQNDIGFMLTILGAYFNPVRDYRPKDVQYFTGLLKEMETLTTTRKLPKTIVAVSNYIMAFAYGSLGNIPLAIKLFETALPDLTGEMLQFAQTKINKLKGLASDVNENKTEPGFSEDPNCVGGVCILPAPKPICTALFAEA